MGYVLGYVLMRSALQRIPAAAAVEGEPKNSDHALQFAPARRFLRPWHVAAAPHTFGPTNTGLSVRQPLRDSPSEKGEMPPEEAPNRGHLESPTSQQRKQANPKQAHQQREDANGVGGV